MNVLVTAVSAAALVVGLTVLLIRKAHLGSFGRTLLQ